jgi:hypothetical protein
VEVGIERAGLVEGRRAPPEPAVAIDSRRSPPGGSLAEQAAIRRDDG